MKNITKIYGKTIKPNMPSVNMRESSARGECKWSVPEVGT